VSFSMLGSREFEVAEQERNADHVIFQIGLL